MLADRTGIDLGYHNCGAIEVASNETEHDFHEHVAQWQAEDIRIEHLTASEIQRHVAEMDDRFTEAVYLPDFCQVRNPRYLQALRAACQQRGVEILEHVHALDISRKDDRISRFASEIARCRLIRFASPRERGLLLYSNRWGVPFR